MQAFRPHPRAVQRLGKLAQKATDRIAGRMVAEAQANAPVVTGRYRASIHAEDASSPDGAATRIVADVEYALDVEARHNTLGGVLHR